MKKINEIHILLDKSGHGTLADWFNLPIGQHAYSTYVDTLEAIKSGEQIVYTTQLEFLDFFVAERLYVHYKGKIHRIQVGGGDINDCCQDIKEYHNLVKMLRSGCFNWFPNE